jgi:hypothetical protein
MNTRTEITKETRVNIMLVAALLLGAWKASEVINDWENRLTNIEKTITEIQACQGEGA